MKMNFETIPLYTLITTYISFLVLIIVGHARDLFGKIFYPGSYSHVKRKDGMEPLFSDFESFFTRRMYTRIRDCWNRPIRGVPGKILQVLERKSDNKNVSFTLTGNIIEAMNVGSYNYLGLATNDLEFLKDVINVTKTYPVNYPGCTRDIGTNPICEELEREMADFLHKEDCMVFPMGFGTNSCNLPVIMDRDCLIFSDELNHTSIVYGTRMSDANVKTFAHNNMKDLENKLKHYISQGQPVTHRSWRKVFVVVEGIYSMEGTILKLKELVKLKKKYKFYLFVDEAHSIGALGKTGRGVCEFLNVDFDEVDILMGTFTKSFGGSGGYIASSKALIHFLRNYSDFSLSGEQMSPIVAQQTLDALKIIKYSPLGKKLAKNLHENTVYIREKLMQLGYVIFGDTASPVVPLMIFNPGKIAVFSRMCLERKLAIVVVGYPATPVISNRARFCISGAHTRHDIDAMIRIIDYCGKICGLNIIKK
ncbi:serine palmitoyltransferase component [Gurleya vavrai]